VSGSPLRGRSGVIEFMCEPCRKFSHRSQTVALLFHPSGFANSVGHEANKTLRQFRHLLHKLGEERRRETQDLCVRRRSGVQRKLLHSRKGQNAGYVSRLGREHHSFAAEFATNTAYMYSTYEEECEAQPTGRKKVIVLGGGPNRIGQGIEFDYCCVHAAFALREIGVPIEWVGVGEKVDDLIPFDKKSYLSGLFENNS
jgi:hypothetical protein